MTVMDYPSTVAASPSAANDLFEKAVNLSRDDFDKEFDAAVRSNGGFSVVAPKLQKKD
jgi:hypothetical protein